MAEPRKVGVTTMQLCRRCGGKGLHEIPCPEKRAGCLVRHSARCYRCLGTGRELDPVGVWRAAQDDESEVSNGDE